MSIMERVEVLKFKYEILRNGFKDGIIAENVYRREVNKIDNEISNVLNGVNINKRIGA